MGKPEQRRQMEQKNKHPFRLLRMAAAAVLFFVLVTAFHYDVSYRGFDKNAVKQMLANQEHWDSLAEKTARVIEILMEE